MREPLNLELHFKPRSTAVKPLTKSCYEFFIASLPNSALLYNEANSVTPLYIETEPYAELGHRTKCTALCSPFGLS